MILSSDANVTVTSERTRKTLSYIYIPDTCPKVSYQDCIIIIIIIILYHITLIESCQTHNTQMSIMSNVLNKRTTINTTGNTMAADL